MITGGSGVPTPQEPEITVPAQAAKIAALCATLAASVTELGWTEVRRALGYLPVALKEIRERERLTVRDVERLSGVPFNTISRFERGSDIYLSNAMKLTRWLGDRSEIAGGERP